MVLLAAIVTDVPTPATNRPVADTSDAAYGEGGTKKSDGLTAVPSGVETVIRPPITADGLAIPKLVLLALVTLAKPTFSLVRLLSATESKFVPDTMIAVPGIPIVGVMLVIVGALLAWTLKTPPLVADPPGALTEIVPVVAPVGTVTVSCVVVAADTVVGVPLNVTES